MSSRRDIIPTDKILPVHYWDDTPVFRSIVVHHLLRFDDILDVQKLQGSLTKLLNRDGWRRLGARLKINAEKKLEYHVPAEFNDQRPAIAFHHEQHQIGINSHPVASRLPQASTSPQIVGRGDDFISLMRRPEDPKSLQDYLDKDQPILGLHVVSFTDATLVTLSWSHVLTDAMGRKDLLDAWSLMLQGREDEVLPLYGEEIDPMAKLGTQPTETYRHADKEFTTRQRIIFGLRYVYDQLFRRPKDETMIVCVPAAYVELMRATAQKDATAASSDKSETKPFVSTGDVLGAWWTRKILSCIARDPSQTISINLAFGLRWLLTRDLLLPAKSVLFGNAITYIPTFIKASNVKNLPLGEVALALRKSLEELGTKEQVEARLALDRAAQDKTGNPTLYGDSWMHMVICTNWLKAKYYSTDFSGAIIKQGPRTGAQKPGQPSYVQLHAFAKGFPLISGFSITGKDANGNYWLSSVLRKQYWKKVEQALKATDQKP